MASRFGVIGRVLQFTVRLLRVLPRQRNAENLVDDESDDESDDKRELLGEDEKSVGGRSAVMFSGCSRAIPPRRHVRTNTRTGKQEL